jgi:hypothetical protein
MLTLKQAARRLRLSVVRTRVLAQTGRIVGAKRFGPIWICPDKVVIHPPLKIEHRRKKGGKK